MNDSWCLKGENASLFKKVVFIPVIQVPQFSRVFCPTSLFSPRFLCKNWIGQNIRLGSEDWVDDPCWRTHPCSTYYTVELKLGFGVITLLDLQGEIDHNTWPNKRNSKPVDSAAGGWASLTIFILKFNNIYSKTLIVCCCGAEQLIRKSSQLNMWKQLQKNTDAADRTQHTGNMQSVQRCQLDIM